MARAKVVEMAPSEGAEDESDLLPEDVETTPLGEVAESVTVSFGDTAPTPSVSWSSSSSTAGSAYDSRNPNFTAGGTAYVRAFCPECAEPMFFSVDTDVQLTIKGDERKLKPTFKATAKPHACHQIVTEFITGSSAGTVFGEVPEVPGPGVEPAPGPCPCSECVGGCDGESEDGIERCTPCRTGQHVTDDTPTDEEDGA